MNDNATKQFLTVKELAPILGISVSTVWRCVSLGQLPKPVKIGGATRWRISTIEAWLADLEGNAKGD